MSCVCTHLIHLILVIHLVHLIHLILPDGQLSEHLHCQGKSLGYWPIWPAYSSLFCFHASSPASPNIVKAKKLRREPCPAKQPDWLDPRVGRGTWLNLVQPSSQVAQPTFNELGNLTLDQPNFHTVGHPSSYSDHLLHHPSVFPFQRQSSESSILLHSIHALMEFKTYLKMWKILVFSQNIHQDKYWYIYSSHVTLTSPIASFQRFSYNNHTPPPSQSHLGSHWGTNTNTNTIISSPPWHLRSHFACQPHTNAAHLWWHLTPSALHKVAMQGSIQCLKFSIVLYRIVSYGTTTGPLRQNMRSWGSSNMWAR